MNNKAAEKDRNTLASFKLGYATRESSFFLSKNYDVYPLHLVSVILLITTLGNVCVGGTEIASNFPTQS